MWNKNSINFQKIDPNLSKDSQNLALQKEFVVFA